MAKYVTIICRVKGETILRLGDDVNRVDTCDVYYYNHTDDDCDNDDNKVVESHDRPTEDNDSVSDINRVKQEVCEYSFRDYQKLIDSFDENYSKVTETVTKDIVNASVTRGQSLESYRTYLMICKRNGRQVFVCKWKNCNYHSLWRNAIANHIRNHMQYFPYVCQYPGCDKSFAIPSNLNNHRKVHSGRPNHLLQMNANEDNSRQNGSQTQKVFNRKSNTNMKVNHKKKTHLSQKKSFVDKVNDNTIKKSITDNGSQRRNNRENKIKTEESDVTNESQTQGVGKPTFVGLKSVEQYFTTSERDGKTWRSCVFCDYSTTYGTSIIYHMRNRHFDDKQYVCGVCGKRFAIQTNLNNHKKVHKSRKPH